MKLKIKIARNVKQTSMGFSIMNAGGETLENNLQSISEIIDYIENHLEDELDLTSIADAAGYSKYHLHRMFTSVVGFTVHTYVQRRRLTEAARQLVFTSQPILEIALRAGYETQRSFSVAFKALFAQSPKAVRKQKDFHPLQLKFLVDGSKHLRGDMAVDIKTVSSGNITVVGYRVNTKNGFFVIGKCMRKLIANQEKITGRLDAQCLIGLNDYTNEFSCEKEQPNFDFYGAAEVAQGAVIPTGMVTKTLPASKYVVFTFKGRPQDPLQPVADYIYKEWFPQSTCQFNENNRYDFTKSFEGEDNEGNSKIEYWVPIL